VHWEWRNCAPEGTKKKKKYIEIPRPEVIEKYNSSMGGVDKMDFLLPSIKRILDLKNGLCGCSLMP
jgi:hypothetical protein